MINIVLNKIHIQPIDLVEALEQYNLKFLTPEICDLIHPIMPTDAEIKTFATTQIENEEDLTLADQYILIMSNFVAPRERALSILFSLEYKENFRVLEEEADKFDKAFDFLKKDLNFHKFLEIILALGNYLNGTSIKGGANGFKIGLLSKLKELKSKDGKKTFIQYVVEFINDQLKKEDMLKFVEKLEIFKNLQYVAITEGIQGIEKKFTDVKKLKKKIEEKKLELLDTDKSFDFLDGFYKDAEEKIKNFNQRIEKIDTEYKEIQKYFEEDSKTEFAVFINYFKVFYNDLIEAFAWFEELKVKRSKKAKKKKK